MLVLERDQDRCVRCGAACTGQRGRDWSIQHRIPRGMGGSRREDINRAANLLTMCGSGTTGCHGWIETTAQGREEARENGWALSKFCPDPTQYPVTLLTDDLGTVSAYLDNDGGVREAPQGGVSDGKDQEH